MAKDTAAPTPRTWPEGMIPTNEQMADWLEVCTRWERIAFVQNARMNSDDAQRCLMENHRSLRAEVEHLRKRYHPDLLTADRPEHPGPQPTATTVRANPSNGATG